MTDSKAQVLRHSSSITWLDMAVYALNTSACINTGDKSRNDEMDKMVDRLIEIRESIAGELNDMIGAEVIE